VLRRRRATSFRALAFRPPALLCLTHTHPTPCYPLLVLKGHKSDFDASTQLRRRRALPSPRILGALLPLFPALSHSHTRTRAALSYPPPLQGHAKRSYYNVHAYSSVYGTKCLGISNLPHAAPNDFFAEGYYGNKCILSSAGAPYLQMGSCTPDATFASRMVVGNNSVFAPNASVTVSCGKGYSFEEWVALGLDVGSTVADLPTVDEMVQMFKDTLGLW